MEKYCTEESSGYTGIRPLKFAFERASNGLVSVVDRPTVPPLLAPKAASALMLLCGSKI